MASTNCSCCYGDFDTDILTHIWLIVSIFWFININSTSSFARSATSPSFAYVSNPVRIALCAELLLPDCVRFSCCSLRDCVSTAAELLACIHFSCCSPLASASTLLPDGVRFVCCSPIASASTAAPRLCPLPVSCSGRFQPCPLFIFPLATVR